MTNLGLKTVEKLRNYLRTSLVKFKKMLRTGKVNLRSSVKFWTSEQNVWVKYKRCGRVGSCYCK